MKVILNKTNEIKEVAFGYAVNYLIPQGLAVLATDQAIEKLEKKEKEKKGKAEEKSKENKKRAQELQGKEFTTKKKTGKAGKLYEALTKKKLAKIIGVKAKEVILKEPIKKTGEYKIELKIGEEKIKVKVKIQEIKLKKQKKKKKKKKKK